MFKGFDINYRPLFSPIIIHINWCPPWPKWVKCNKDISSRGNSGLSTCGSIFQNAIGNYLGSFSYNIGIYLLILKKSSMV